MKTEYYTVYIKAINIHFIDYISKRHESMTKLIYFVIYDCSQNYNLLFIHYAWMYCTIAFIYVSSTYQI